MRTRFQRRLLTCWFAFFVVSCAPVWGQATVTLSSSSPSAGQPGVTVINVLGSGYPAGTIPPTDVSVTLQPATAGAGPSGATLASAVTTIVGSTRRVTFTIPTTISVTNPTTYRVSISGMTSTGTSFASGNTATLTVNPAASILSLTPNTGQPGQTLSITLTCAYTNLVTGASQVSFGPGIAVGSAAEGAFGPVTATSATTATFQITIDAAAVSGPRTVQVQTGVQTASLTAGFSVTSPVTSLPPPTAAPGGPYTGVAGQSVTFRGAASSNPAGNPLTFQWFFGDGGTDNSGPNPTHIYASTGVYSVTLIVTDSQREIACGASENLVQCLQADTGSAVTSATISKTGNTTPPTVTITSPASLALLSQRSVNVTGTVSDPNFATVPVVVNGVTATVTGGAFQATVPLREGDNVLAATATDGAGNIGTASLTVVVDTTVPNIQINMPATNTVVSSPAIDVTGIVNDAVSGTVNAAQVTVTVNGLPATVSNRSFLASGVPLNSGANTIVAVATDRAGNHSQTQIQVTRQTSFQPQILMVSGNAQSGLINKSLPNPLVVRLVDATGNPLAVRPVTFTVVRSDGQLLGVGKSGQTVVVNTDGSGQASIFFQLGSRVGAGINQVAVTYAGSTMQTEFSETSLVGPPAGIFVVSGNSQLGVIGQALPIPFVAIVNDSGGNPVPGVSVNFTVKMGGGSIGGSTTFTQASDTDGKVRAALILGLQQGINNNVVSANFMGAAGVPATFTASGVVPGSPSATQVSGVVLDNANTPVPNATATIVGTNLSALSNNQGVFTITGAPVGAITLMVDGRTSNRPETFPFLSFQMTTIAGQNNTIGMPVLLPPLDTTDSQIVGGSQNVVLSMAGVPGFQLTVFANSATFPDGTHVGRMSMSQVHADKVPMLPPNGTAPLIVGTLQPPGVVFNPPVQFQIPNLNGLAPGTVVDVFSFDHDLEQFISQGPARVSSDGSVVVSDAGFGIVKSGWFGGGPPPPPPACADTPQPTDCQQVVDCQLVDQQDGTLCTGISDLGALIGSDFAIQAAAIGDCSPPTPGSCNVQFIDFNYFNSANLTFQVDSSCFGQCQSGVCQPSPNGFNVPSIVYGVDSALGPLFDPFNACIAPGFKSAMQSNALLEPSGIGVPGVLFTCSTLPPPSSSESANVAAYAPLGGRTVVLEPPAFAGPMPPTVFHELVHAFSAVLGSPDHNNYGTKGYPPLQGTNAQLFEYQNDTVYGCQQSCFPGSLVVTANPAACHFP